MANVKVSQLPTIAVAATGSIAYITDGGQSYQGAIDKIATVLLNNYNIFSSPVSASLMTTGNAEVMLAGLNNAQTSQLDADRVDLTAVYDDINAISFDIDGGTFYDTYVNSTTFDGGTI